MSGHALGRAGTALAALALAGGLLVGCSGDEDDSGGAEAGDSPSASESSSGTTAPTEPSLPVPDGVELTTQGSMLEVGDTATVAYEVRQGVVGVLDIKVTRLEKTSFKKSFVGWDLDQQQKKSNPYFVRVTVTNRGETDLGGRRVPLYIVDGNNTLVEAQSFGSVFRPCEPATFPKKFRAGKKVKACMVYLSPKKGDLTAVSFRPTQEYDPIVWSGELQAPKPPKPDKKKNKGDKGDG